MKTPEDAVGRRVSCDGERGTVRYVGPVPPTAGPSPFIQHYMMISFFTISLMFLCLLCRCVAGSGVG
uniref:Uncharacterized protein n=1 Tax=Sinocyclocheilus grahami TaxID=75366 RepID=A0A672KBQ4_SINGR